MKKKFIRGLCVLLVSVPLSLSAQTSTAVNTANRYYKEGTALFDKESYAAATSSLVKFVEQASDASLIQEAEYMLVVSAYHLRDINRVELLEDYLNKYPDSPHTNQLNGLLGSVYYFNEDYDYALAYFNSVDLDYLSAKDREDLVYRQATSYLKVGRFQDAVTWFETLRLTSSKYAKDSQYYVSYIRYTQGNYDEALKGFLPLQMDDKYGELVPYYIASSYFLKGHYDKAQIVAEGYLTQYPNHKYTAEMHRIYAEASYQYAQYPRAIRHFEEFLQTGQSLSRGSAYMLGMSYYNTGVYSKAVRYLGEAVANTSQDDLAQNAYLNLGLSYIQLADKTNARMAFEQAASMDVNRAVKEQALYNYAMTIHETSFSAFGESVNVFEQFLNEFPNSAYADKVGDYLVEVYTNTKNYDAALKSIARIDRPSLRVLEAKQKLLFQLGVQYFANSDFNQAIDNFSESIGLGQYNPQVKADATYWRGESFYRLDRLDEAARNFRDYLTLSPVKSGETYALAHYNLGYIAFNRKNFGEAEGWFSRYTQYTTGANRVALADAFNRRGDCHMQRREFTQAKGNYSRALHSSTAVGDYSIYQMALVAGLQKNYSEKINLLSRLGNEYPESPYLAQGWYEKGRSYVQQKNHTQAINAFQTLIQKYPENPTARRAANEVALLYYQDGNYDKAIQSYKWVAQKYPGSAEARMAVRDLKSIYVDLNRVDEYAQAVESLPGSIRVEVTEQDSLTYIAAEKVYLRGAEQEAQRSFESYLRTYPSGAFSLNAHYYLSVLANKQGRVDDVVAHTSKLLEYPDNPYYEEALVLASELAQKQGRWNDALDYFKKLKTKASTPDRILLAQVGSMRAAKQLQLNKEIILAASELLQNNKLTPEFRVEALYNRSKAYLADQKVNDAVKDLQLLGKDTRTIYGAEAKYLLADIYYQAKNYEAAEKEILDFIEQSTPHAYWLARSFILLSDVYVALGKDFEARQYLLSLKQNYQADDEITAMINSRLDKLKIDNE